MSKQDLPQKFKRLPPIAGIPFSGFEFARIESRVKVEEKIRNFLYECFDSKFLNVAFIRAEWGEGKTDAYERYIKTEAERHGDYVYLVSASTLGDKVSRIDHLFPDESTSSAKFLACLFTAARDELRSRTGRGDPFIGKRSGDALEYVQEVLEFHFSDHAHMFIFIDEFEEILGLSLNAQRFILSGIKELINGQVGVLHQGGRYAGRLHLIIACTPYAYNRIKDNVELAEIFGSFASRLRLIDLPQLKRFEVYQFIMDLIKYSYDGNLPTPLPFSTAGVLNTLAIMSQKNPRAIVQLYVDLMSTAGQAEGMKMVDYEIILNALKDKELSIFGGATKCIDSELLTSILGYLSGLTTRSEDCIALFKLLAGELKPFSHDQIKERLGLDDQDIYACLDIINREIQRVGIQQAIIRYMPLIKEKNFDDVLRLLSPVEGEVQLHTSKLSVDKLRDGMIYYEFGTSGNLLPYVVLPKNAKDIEMVFDIDSDDAQWLYEKMAKVFEDSAKSRYYMLSHEVIEQIFPSPIWLLIDFIKDRSKRMELWREVAKSRTQLAGMLEEAFSGLVIGTGRLRLEKKQNYYLLHYEHVTGRTIQIPAIVYASATGVNLNDVRTLLQSASSIDALIAFIVYVGEMDSGAQQFLASKLLPLPIHLRPIRAQQLLVERLARKNGIELNPSLLELRINEILYELDIGRIFDEWINKVRLHGVVIDDLKKKYGKNDKELAQVCKIFINQTGLKMTLRDVFESYNILDSFRVYGEKCDLIPFDLETEDELRQFQENLIINGFLEYSDGNSVVVKDTPIESRILEMIKTGGLSKEGIKRRFIILSANEDILDQVYIPILEYKGKVTLEEPRICPVNRFKAEKGMMEECNKFFEELKIKRSSPWWGFAHICVSKERADRVITIEDFENYVLKQREYVRTINDENVLLQRSHLIHQLIEHYNARLEPRITMALSRAEAIFKNVLSSLKAVEDTIQSILDSYNIYSRERTYKKDEVAEYEALNKKLESVKHIMDQTYTKTDLQSEMELLRKETGGGRERLPFFFRKDDGSASYFNFKLYSLQKSVDDFDNHAKNIMDMGKRILDCRDKTDSLTNGIRGKLLMLKVDDKLKVSSELYKRIRQIKVRPIEAEPSAKLSLEKDLQNFFASTYSIISSFSREVESVTSNLSRIIKSEEGVLDFLATLDGELKNLTQFVKQSEFQGKAEPLEKKLEVIKDTYGRMVTETTRTERDTVEGLKSYVQEVASDADNLLNDLKSLKQEEMKLIEEQKAYLRDYKERVEHFFNTLKGEPKAERLSQSFSTLIDEAVKVTESSLNTFSNITWSQLVTELDDFRAKVYTELESIIPKDESSVLFELIKYVPEKGWQDLGMIVKNVSISLNLKEEDVLQIIRKIVKRGFLREGLSYPF